MWPRFATAGGESSRRRDVDCIDILVRLANNHAAKNRSFSVADVGLKVALPLDFNKNEGYLRQCCSFWENAWCRPEIQSFYRENLYSMRCLCVK